MKTRQDVLQGNKNCVTHVQTTSHIGGRHGQHIWFFTLDRLLFRVWLETSSLFPPLVYLIFEGRRLVLVQASLLVEAIITLRFNYF